MANPQPDTPAGNNFLRGLIARQIAAGEHSGPVVTRFPPEPNGYLHIGHAKSVWLNFGLAAEFGGHCNLRFDDTNPGAENPEYVAAIEEDVRWLGYQWAGPVRHASDYFEQLYDYARQLIRAGLAYVDEQSVEQARASRGSLTEPGSNSPHRERPVAENLALFERMRAGEFDEGACVLRAKIDMAAPNMNLRDPVLYRIRKAAHHRSGDAWCIYPSYDFAHGQSDAIEGITHSICTLEFEDHRPLYDWLIEHLPLPSRPRQYEFARLNVDYTITSKRRLKTLVDNGIVDGWDDPRLPTICGLRRRGVTPAALRAFCAMVGVSRADSVVEVAMLEHAVRDDLNENAARGMAVIDPLKLVLTNLPEDHLEWLAAAGHPQRDEFPQRQLPFTRALFIEREDFREQANKKYKRLVLGKKVRLRNAYVVTAEDLVKDAAGEVIEVHCRVDLDTLGADPADGVKPKGVIHWVSASHGRRATVRLYDRLFEHPAPGEDYLEHLNPGALEVRDNCWIEPGLADCAPEERRQFERLGYFVADRYDHRPSAPVFNRTVPLRDSWAKIEARDEAP